MSASERITNIFQCKQKQECCWSKSRYILLKCHNITHTPEFNHHCQPLVFAQHTCIQRVSKWALKITVAATPPDSPGCRRRVSVRNLLKLRCPSIHSGIHHSKASCSSGALRAWGMDRRWSVKTFLNTERDIFLTSKTVKAEVVVHWHSDSHTARRRNDDSGAAPNILFWFHTVLFPQLVFLLIPTWPYLHFSRLHFILH